MIVQFFGFGPKGLYPFFRVVKGRLNGLTFTCRSGFCSIPSAVLVCLVAEEVFVKVW